MSVLNSRFVRNSKDAVTGLSRKYSTLKCLQGWVVLKKTETCFITNDKAREFFTNPKNNCFTFSEENLVMFKFKQTWNPTILNVPIISLKSLTGTIIDRENSSNERSSIPVFRFIADYAAL